MPDLLTGNYGGKTPPRVGAGNNGTQFKGRASNTPLIGSGRGGDSTAGVRKLARGMMRSTVGKSTIFNFMYNPPEVNYSYDINEGQLSQEAIADDPTGLGGIPNLVGGASISFVLYFDRSIEVANGGGTREGSIQPGNSFSAAKIGVLHDLDVYERLVGEVETGTVVSKPVKVYFTRGNQAGSALNFQGMITGTQVVFKQFNQDMIPTRMEMAITMRKLYVPGTLSEPAAASEPRNGPAPTSNPGARGSVPQVSKTSPPAGGAGQHQAEPFRPVPEPYSPPPGGVGQRNQGSTSDTLPEWDIAVNRRNRNFL